MSSNQQYTNRLIHESSPYLLQHAHNPVNWYPWGEEALALAREQDKPILVSIGYAACHWCHVMERESFEDAAVATLMNEWFVNIKIDREERPDLDHIYMDALQAMTGSGGWPLNVFLTPEGKPFYGGTYFPPERLYNRASWKEVITAIHQGFTERRADMDQQAENLTLHLINANRTGEAKTDGELSSTACYSISEQILQQADTEWGGFGKAPKFPQTYAIRFLIRHHYYTGDEQALAQALLSLDRMLAGGLYDQLGGGFARYSTDREWLVPHFEKMLYDNALLVMAYCEAYQLTGYARYQRAIEETLAFVEREMMHENGAFYSALDADSEGVEGKFYTWSLSEIEEVLGAEAKDFCAFYDITEEGNWEHTNIPWMKAFPETYAAENGLNPLQWLDQLAIWKGQLMQRRAGRIRPLLDDKVLLGWNALMNRAYTMAYACLGNSHYRELAEKNMRFLEAHLYNSETGEWHHTWKEGKAKVPAFLDDLAYLIQARIGLQEVTGNGDYLHAAKTCLEWVQAHFMDGETGLYFYTPEGQKDVIIRKKELYDGATPSGNATMAQNLQYLSRVFDHQPWKQQMKTMLLRMETTVSRYPTSFGAWAIAIQAEWRGWKEIALMGKGAEALLPGVLAKYAPDKIIQCGETKEGEFPLLHGKMPKKEGETRLYVCKDFTCRDFTTDKMSDFLANV
jgi:uncharacterized protein YyaL (SSP411 family)